MRSLDPIEKKSALNKSQVSPKLDRRVHPHQTGERLKQTQYDPPARFESSDDVRLFERDGKVRPDWLIVNVAAFAASALPAAAAAATAPAVATQHATPSSVEAIKPPASAAPSIEERLLRLKRLHEQDLITDEEYARKRHEILDQL